LPTLQSRHRDQAGTARDPLPSSPAGWTALAAPPEPLAFQCRPLPRANAPSSACRRRDARARPKPRPGVYFPRSAAPTAGRRSPISYGAARTLCRCQRTPTATRHSKYHCCQGQILFMLIKVTETARSSVYRTEAQPPSTTVASGRLCRRCPPGAANPPPECQCQRKSQRLSEVKPRQRGAPCN